MVTSVVHHVKLDFIKQSAVKIIVSNVQWEHQQVQTGSTSENQCLCK